MTTALTPLEDFRTRLFAVLSFRLPLPAGRTTITYSATADVNVHGVDKSWPVEFEVADQSDSSVTIVAEHKFSRLDFGIGKAEGDSTATDVVATLKLTLEDS